MNKINILYYIIMGNIIINIPIATFCFFELFWPKSNLDFASIFYVISFSFAYWAIMIPYYKFYSIRNLKTNEEFMFWEKWSIYTLLIWPNNLKIYRLECWDKKNLEIFKKLRKNLITKC